MSDEERKVIMRQRRARGGTWHRPPLWDNGRARYLITAACFEHRPVIGGSPMRMAAFESDLLALLEQRSDSVYAHVVLPNHYHVLVECDDVRGLRHELGQLHGRMAYAWNREDRCRGRKIFYGSAETKMKSERHFQATLNYIHHNPVKHRYVERWQDWPYSSAVCYLTTVGEAEARKHWLEYPVDHYGEAWDVP